MKTKKSEPKKSKRQVDARFKRLGSVPEVTPEAEALLEWLLNMGVVAVTPAGAEFFSAVHAEHDRRRLAEASS
ncbi:MAG: hypothetical protein Q8L14_08435 [Myxococcales bacterium]|nr:hypothetical protein [Myxococcales bacterium]